ncbi:C-type lectin 37Db-like [Drosophila nasuta]|uniref:C-type lectin 37Db-like n=1 Tax=Drosophila nasuta TaxID=42062 RepID=UPI00295E67C5|nr:C-type lectin 37Db-like [Drosophila nasuta]
MLWHKLIAFAVLSLVLCQLHQVNGNDSGCQANFTRVGDTCLKNVSNWYSWYEADRHCRSLGAELVSLQNQEQLQEINKWLNTTGLFMLNFWTSGNRLGRIGNYYWQGTGQEASYLPWGTGQPQSTGNCLLLSSKTWGVADYHMEVYNCESWSSAVCEQRPQQYTSRLCLKQDSYESVQVLVN